MSVVLRGDDAEHGGGLGQVERALGPMSSRPMPSALATSSAVRCARPRGS